MFFWSLSKQTDKLFFSCDSLYIGRNHNDAIVRLILSPVHKLKHTENSMLYSYRDNRSNDLLKYSETFLLMHQMPSGCLPGWILRNHPSTNRDHQNQHCLSFFMNFTFRSDIRCGIYVHETSFSCIIPIQSYYTWILGNKLFDICAKYKLLLSSRNQMTKENSINLFKINVD